MHRESSSDNRKKPKLRPSICLTLSGQGAYWTLSQVVVRLYTEKESEEL